MLRRPSIRLFSATLLTATFFASCASTSTHTDPTAPTAASTSAPAAQGTAKPTLVAPRSPAEERALADDPDYRAMQTLYSEGKHDALIVKSTDYEKRNPQSPLLSYVRNIRGLSYLAQKKPLLAIAQFQRALDARASETIKPYIQYNLAAALSDADQADDSLETLKEILPERLNADSRGKYYALKAKTLLMKEAWVESARSTLQAAFVIGAPAAARPQLTELLDRATSQITRQEELLAVVSGLEASPLADRVRARLQPGYETRGTQGAAAVDSVADSRKIGVLLPLSGKFGNFGTRTLKAITMALKLYEPNGIEYTLEIEDSGDTAEQSIRALNRLATRRGVAVVIGPLLSKGIDQVTARAQTLGIPLVNLAQQPGAKGDYVFSAGLTPALQAREIAKVAIERLGLKKFAIVYPRDKFGEEYSQSYWDAVTSLGGTVVGVESYKPGETDFRTVIDKLVGIHYKEARKREVAELARQRATLNITKRNRKTAKYFDLPPIVDFEAVFIPDDPKTASLILPTFAYRDVENIKFLGISTWNNADLVSRAANYAEGAVFVDGLFVGSSSPASQRFVERFSQGGGSAPSSIEAMAYDAALIVDEALKKFTGNVRRSEVRQSLAGISRFNGITGRITAQDGEFKRDLQVLTVQGGQIVEMK